MVDPGSPQRDIPERPNSYVVDDKGVSVLPPGDQTDPDSIGPIPTNNKGFNTALKTYTRGP